MRAMLAALLAAGLALGGCGRGGSTPELPQPAGPVPQDAPQVAANDRGRAERLPTRFLAGAATPAATLPHDIARGLSTDARVLDCPGGVSGGRSAFAPDWVVVHRVDVDGAGDSDWLVEGRHRCLAGPDGADWWLYAEDWGARRLVLATGRARALEVLPQRSHGVHDLRLWREGEEGIHMHYDGAAYVPAERRD